MSRSTKLRSPDKHSNKSSSSETKMIQNQRVTSRTCPKTCPKHQQLKRNPPPPNRTRLTSLDDGSESSGISPERQKLSKKHGNRLNIDCKALDNANEGYQQINCNDTIWTIKIMKDAANTAKCLNYNPAIVQTSLTTIINANKLETLLPIKERYKEELPSETALSSSNRPQRQKKIQTEVPTEGFLVCVPCQEALMRQNKPALAIDEVKMKESKTTQDNQRCEPCSRSRSRSRSPKSCCMCFRKRKKRYPRQKSVRIVRPDYHTNCSENYIC
ncbi:uncharacterized protein [Onthophagus taurus]|uniref:uncharacterized protein isoform X1 n=1 Tax=Onthophagus taurus TaxID=166361 RepID=UPI0039BE6BCD